MKQEEKELLLKDLCARLPYGVKIRLGDYNYQVCGYDSEKEMPVKIWYYYDSNRTLKSYIDVYLTDYRPYLRPMSSMTKEERAELGEIIKTCGLSPYGEITESGEDNLLRCTVKQAFLMLNYLYSKHFDINHLIDPGLAIEAPEGMY